MWQLPAFLPWPFLPAAAMDNPSDENVLTDKKLLWRKEYFVG
jgi:hypothetical protein